jgi:inorganic pyrophosphatase
MDRYIVRGNNIGKNMRSAFLTFLIALLFVTTFSIAADKDTSQVVVADDVTFIDEKTIAAKVNLLTGVPPNDDQGNYNVVIENPTGTNEVWKVDKTTGYLNWSYMDKSPISITYLSYPCNLGFIPQTMIPLYEGGSGDPLDVIVLGPLIPRGEVVPVRVIGVMYMNEYGKKDDKIVAVPLRGPFAGVGTVGGLAIRYHGTMEILETWFKNYHGIGNNFVDGWGNEWEAAGMLDRAIAGYKEHQESKNSEESEDK